MPRKRSSKAVRHERLRNLKKAISKNSQMSAHQKMRARATINRELGFRPRSYSQKSLSQSSFRSTRRFTRNSSDRLMREGLQELGEVIIGWLSEPIQKAMDIFHIARGSAKVVRAIDQQDEPQKGSGK